MGYEFKVLIFIITEKGSSLLIEEFPNNRDLENATEEINKI